MKNKPSKHLQGATKEIRLSYLEAIKKYEEATAKEIFDVIDDYINGIHIEEKTAQRIFLQALEPLMKKYGYK